MARGNVWYRERILALRRKAACVHCGTKRYLEFAHIQPNGGENRGRQGRGRNRRILFILKYPETYTVFCRGCHDLYDGGELAEQIRVQNLIELGLVATV